MMPKSQMSEVFIGTLKGGGKGEEGRGLDLRTEALLPNYYRY